MKMPNIEAKSPNDFQALTNTVVVLSLLHACMFLLDGSEVRILSVWSLFVGSAWALDDSELRMSSPESPTPARKTLHRGTQLYYVTPPQSVSLHLLYYVKILPIVIYDTW